MYRTVISVVLLTAALLFSGDEAQAQDSASRPLVAAVYYTWYGTPSGGSGYYQKWEWDKDSAVRPGACSDATVVLPSTFPQINSCAYPLVGRYDSMDREVVRWHIRLAKAAGIDAFLVDWWGSGAWQNPRGWTYDVFANVVLPVAEQEGFKVALYDETPQFLSDFSSVKSNIATHIQQFAESPAYLKIDGEPVYALYQAGLGKLTAAQITDLIESVQASTGPVYWILTKMRARWNKNRQIEIFTPEEFLSIPSLDAIMGYTMFSTWNLHHYEELAPRYQFWANQVHAAGKEIMIPVHPGYQKLTTQPKSEMPRYDGQTLRDFWQAALYAKADLICITSWNEWMETTVVEPSLSWPDPYQYLKIIAEFQGKTEFIAPPLPDSEHIEPVVRQYLDEKGVTH